MHHLKVNKNNGVTAKLLPPMFVACEEGGHTPEYLFDNYWWTWKTTTEENFEKEQFEKIKKNTWRYYYSTPLYQEYWWYDL